MAWHKHWMLWERRLWQDNKEVATASQWVQHENGARTGQHLHPGLPAPHCRDISFCAGFLKNESLINYIRLWYLLLCICEKKNTDQKHVGEEKVYFCLLLIVHTEGKPRQELKVRTWRQHKSRDHGGTLHAGLFSVVCLACVITHPRNTYLPMGITTYSELMS